MNTEELEQTTEKGANRNTTSLLIGNVVCQKGSFKAPLPVQNNGITSASSVSLPDWIAQSYCASELERENSGFSIY